MNLFSRGVRNAFRNTVRTGSIVVILSICIGLALAMLVAREAVTAKIETVKSSVGNTVSIAPAGARGFEGGGEPLTSDQASELAAIDNVRSTTQTLSDRLTTDTSSLESAIDAGSLGERNADRSGVGFMQPPSGGMPGGPSAGDGQITRTFTPPITLIGTNNPEKSMSSDGESGKITSGELFANDSNALVAVVGQSLAEKNNLSVDDTFTAYDQKIKVVGIYDTGTDFGNNQALMPLSTVQRLSDQEGDITSIVLTINSADNLASVSESASTIVGENGDVTDSASQVASAIAPLENIQTISLYSLVGATVAGAIIILLTMVMIVRERRREIGVIKAIGGSNIVVMGQFVVEAVTLTLLGTLAGIVVGIAAASPITSTLVSSSSSAETSQAGPTGGPGNMMRDGPSERFGQANRALTQSISNIQTNVGWEILLWGMGMTLVIATAGSALASILISKVRPAEVMRAE